METHKSSNLSEKIHKSMFHFRVYCYVNPQFKRMGET